MEKRRYGAAGPYQIQGFFVRDTPPGKVALAQGDWGELVHDARDYDRLRGANGYSGPGPRLFFSVVQKEPGRLATRLRFVDAVGKEEIEDAVRPWGFHPVRVEIEARPYVWVEFSNVHYDPVPSKWPAAYWGQEGEKAVSRSGGTSLQAIVVPDIVDRKMIPTHVYAPDGRLWRNHPNAAEVIPYWPDLASYGKETNPGSKIIASIRLDPTLAGSEREALIQGFAATSANLGAELGAPLDPSRGYTSRLPAGQYRFIRPKTPYVRFRVNYPQPWRKVGEKALPPAKEVDALTEAAKRDPDRQAGTPIRVLEILVHGAGHASLWSYDPLGDSPQPAFFWTTKSTGTLARLVLRLRDGKRLVAEEGVNSFVSPESAAYGVEEHTGGVYFSIDETGVASTEFQELSGKKTVHVPLRDIAAFEVETKDHGNAVDLVAKLPPATPKP